MGEKNVMYGIVIALGIVCVIWAIYIIINLIISYKKESNKVEEILKEKQKNNEIQNAALQNSNMFSNVMPIQNDEMQMAYAASGQVAMQPYMQVPEENFYASVGHFTDTGTSSLRGGYYNNGFENTYNDMNFVIVKSVICTETREEID